MNNISLKTLFLVVLLAAVLAACGGQTPPATQPAATEEPTPRVTQLPATDKPATQPAEATTPEPAGSDEVSFSADVLPIFEARCIRCHGTSRQNGGLMLNSYAAVLAGGTDGAVVIPGDAAGSTLVRLITEGEMPKNSSPLSAEQITLISDWINAGALDN